MELSIFPLSKLVEVLNYRRAKSTVPAYATQSVLNKYYGACINGEMCDKASV